MVQEACNPAGNDTTSELRVGNGLTGAPVIASMSDGYAVTRVEPWNTIMYPTPDLFRGGYFLCLPQY